MLFYQGQIKVQQTCTGSSTTTIGASSPLLIDSAHSASGVVTATADGPIALDEVE